MLKQSQNHCHGQRAEIGNGTEDGYEKELLLERRLFERAVSDAFYVIFGIRSDVYEIFNISIAINREKMDEFRKVYPPDKFPGVVYVAETDSRTCRICQYLNDRIFPSRHPIWDWICPPVHSWCRCRLLPIPAREKIELSNPYETMFIFIEFLGGHFILSDPA